MNIVTLLPFILLIGVMYLMTRSAKNKQRQAQQMRDQMHPGTGVRTIGGMIALVKEVRDTTVLLEAAPGVHLVLAKNAIGAVLDEEEYDRLVNDDEPLSFTEDAAEEVAADAAPDAVAEESEEKISLGKTDAAPRDTLEAEAESRTTADKAVEDAKDGGK